MSTERNVKRLAIALALSMSLNMFFVGFLVARRMTMRAARERPGFELGPQGFLSRAGIGDGPQVRRVIEGRRDKLRDQRRQLMAARDAVRAALVSEPFEVTKLDGALQKLRAHGGEMQNEMHAALLELAKSLPADERKRLAHAPWLLGPEGPQRPPGMHGGERHGH